MKKIIGIVSVDVEPDNVWHNPQSQEFENIESLPKFQLLCDEYGIKPTYLISYSTVKNSKACGVIEYLLAKGRCEIGAHSHFWEIPPIIPKDMQGFPLVGTQYEKDILFEKIGNLTQLITSFFGTVTSYRSGRWGLDGNQLHILERHGYTADSSVTPGLDWSVTGAPDYSHAPMMPYHPDTEDINKVGASRIWEIPCTIKPGLRLGGLEHTSLGRKILSYVNLGPRWLRCSGGTSSGKLRQLCAWAAARFPHINMMTHSSELCPGTSPYWVNNADIDLHLELVRHIFEWWLVHGIKPITMSEYVLFLAGGNGVAL